MHMFHVIDDEPYIRNILSTMISKAGYLTQDFPSGDAYLTFMNSPEYAPPTAILTDYMMPGMDGYELIQHVRSKLPTQKIILVSGTPECKENEHKNPCHSLQKPFRIGDLDTITTALITCHEDHSGNGHCPFNKTCIFKP